MNEHEKAALESWAQLDEFLQEVLRTVGWKPMPLASDNPLDGFRLWDNS